MSKSKSQIKRLPTTEPKELFKTELPQPELKKVELPPPKPIYVDLGFWEVLWLLITSVLRNKARDAMEGKPVQMLDGDMLNVSPVRLFTAIGGWWRLGVGVVLVGVVVWVVLKIGS